MVWNVLQDQTKLIRNYSTNVGKVWFVVQFIFRLLIVSVVGTQVYGDEVGQFKERHFIDLSLHTVRLDSKGLDGCSQTIMDSGLAPYICRGLFSRFRNDFVGSKRFKKEIKKDLIQGI